VRVFVSEPSDLLVEEGGLVLNCLPLLLVKEVDDVLEVDGLLIDALSEALLL